MSYLGTGPKAKYIPAEATDELVNRAEIQAGARYDEVTANVSVEVYYGDGQHDLRMESFEHRHVMPQLQQNIKSKGWDKPTAVQSATIPLILTKQHDMIVNAPTGQGKSAAFLVPLIQLISFHKRKQKVQENPDSPHAIIFLNTRDLAEQICNQARQLAKGIDNVKVAWAFGQTDMAEQRKVLKEGCDILCVTEGRFVMLIEQKQVKLDQVRYFVIDEADKLLADCDQMPKVRDSIFKALPVDRQTGKPLFRTLMFSATFTLETTQIAEDNFLQPGYFVVRTGKLNQVVDTVKQEVIEVSRWEKRYKLKDILEQWATRKSSDDEG
ncbi:vasa, partial [Aphelenchoides avenae]